MADKYVNTQSLPRMGTEAYNGFNNSGEYRGTLVPKTGNAKGAGDPNMGVAARRSPTMAATLGAAYRITATRAPYSETYPATQANGRVVPSVSGSARNFRSSY